MDNRKALSGSDDESSQKNQEKFFVECPSPSNGEQCQLSNCLEHKHVRFGFPNRRNRAEVQNNHSECAVLKNNIERMKEENFMLFESIIYATCPSCGNLSLAGEGEGSEMALLLQENAQLKREYQRVVDQIIIHLAEVASGSVSSDNAESQPQHEAVSPSVDPRHSRSTSTTIPRLLLDMILIPEIARGSMDELSQLFLKEEMFWTKSETDDKYVLHRGNYDSAFPTAKYYSCRNVHTESSKVSGLVPMNGKCLVNLLLDTDKRVDLFPNLISEAQTVKMLAYGDPYRNGAMQLVYERLHVLSPLIQPREFYVLRFCRHTDVGKWMIVDMTYGLDRNDPRIVPSLHVRHPSGCMVRDLSNGFSEVTWVEHVSIDAMYEAPQLYGDVVLSGLAFGAERWLNTLQRMSERYSYLFDDHVVSECENEASWLELAPARVPRLSVRILKSFCSRLSMCRSLNSPQPTLVNNGDIQIAVVKNTESDEPAGYDISAAKSVWLPVLPRAAFDFLCDSEKRHKWDILCREGTQRIGKLPTGHQEENNISIMTPAEFILRPRNKLIIQESSIDALGALIVFGVTTYPALETLSCPLKTSGLSLLPSGFTISADGTLSQSGCVLTALFNFLLTDALPEDPGQVAGSERVQELLAILISSVEDIKREVCR